MIRSRASSLTVMKKRRNSLFGLIYVIHGLLKTTVTSDAVVMPGE